MKWDLEDDELNYLGIQFFSRVISQHSTVKKLKKISDQLYELERKDDTKLNVYLTDLYTLGITDYFNIRSMYPNVNCIVIASQWHGYTHKAKDQAVADQIGLFTVVDFMKALNHESYWTFGETKNDGDGMRRGNRSA